MTRRRRQLLKPAEDHSRLGDLDNVTHFEPRRETVGDLLRRTREGKGQQLDVVAMRLKIRSGYLKAIEEGRFQDLPGLTYAVGFVRTYADHLGLDSEDVVRRFRDEVAELKSQTQLIFPVVAAEGKIPRGAILLLSAVLAAIAYGGWYYLSEREQSALDLIPELPAKLKALISSDEAAEEPAVAGAPATTAEPAPATPAEATASAAPEAAPAPAVPPAQPTDEAAGTAAPASPPAAESIAAPALGSDETAETAVAASALPEVAPPPTAPDDGTADSAASAAAAASTSAEPVAQAPASAGAATPEPGVPAATPADAPPPPVPALSGSALPTVSAPPAPATGSLANAAPAPDGAALPPVADGQVFGATEGASRIVLVARLESWVQVTDPETNALLTRVLRAGDRYYVPDQAGLTLATGNAGGLDIWVDGRKAPALGPVGVVRRDIALDPQRLAEGTALSE